MQVDIKVTEVLSRIITIDSSSIEGAIQTAKDMYKNEDIVLDYSDFIGEVIIEKDESECKHEREN